MTFTIHADNIIAMLASQETGLREVGTDTFSRPLQLNALAAKSPGPRLVEIRNKLLPIMQISEDRELGYTETFRH